MLAGAAGYFALVEKSEPTAESSTPTPTQTGTTVFPTPIGDPEMAFWKNYRNDAYSFDIKYPSDWTAKGYWSETGGFFYVAFGIANTINSKPLVTLKVYPNQTTLDKFIKYFDYLSGSWKDTTLNNVAAREIISVGQNSKQFILIASVKNVFGYGLESTVFGDNIDTVRKMSSTFKFLK